VQRCPSLPFIAAFCPWFLSPLYSVPSLFHHVSLSGTLGRQSVLPLLPLSACLLIPPAPPTRTSLAICLSSAEMSLFSELRWKDCFSCVYRKNMLVSHKIKGFPYVALGSTSAHAVLRFLDSLFEFDSWWGSAKKEALEAVAEDMRSSITSQLHVIKPGHSLISLFCFAHFFSWKGVIDHYFPLQLWSN